MEAGKQSHSGPGVEANTARKPRKTDGVHRAGKCGAHSPLAQNKNQPQPTCSNKTQIGRGGKQATEKKRAAAQEENRLLKYPPRLNNRQ
ncbi:hypothetical protein NPIL_414601 [Nephila pilipes]|uniref:Uncharacterized protein n=1 Tax=Nephila pilipes TaxID=299642 RepID=A0A8X6NP03_NEPPI|nr:hypothetical protein NPIL_414601 [Nephila pilipes]